MQVHYNLLAGKAPDRSAAELRIAPADRGDHAAGDPACCPAPSSCPAARSTPTGRCATAPAALADVKKRFGEVPGRPPTCSTCCAGR